MSVAGKGSFRLVSIGTALWIKGDRTFLQDAGVSRAKLSLFARKYLRTSTQNTHFGSFAKLCDGSGIAGAFGAATGLTRGPETTVDGQSVVTVSDVSDGSKGFITNSGTPYLVRMQALSSGQLDFLDYDAKVTITAPAASEVLDGSAYGV